MAKRSVLLTIGGILGGTPNFWVSMMSRTQEDHRLARSWNMPLTSIQLATPVRPTMSSLIPTGIPSGKCPVGKAREANYWEVPFRAMVQ